MNNRTEVPINEIMKEYLEKVLEANQLINLTRVTDYDQAVLLHLEDSLAVIKEINESPEGLYADLGSGGGFPGVPIAIATNRETILVDSVKKKMNIIQNILDIVCKDFNITTYSGRIEELSIEKPEQFSVLTARALTNLPSLLELSSPLLIQGGNLVALKSKEEAEFDNDELLDKLGMSLVSKRDFYLSDNETFRTVYTFKKIRQPKIKLPRRIGMAQKRPLG